MNESVSSILLEGFQPWMRQVLDKVTLLGNRGGGTQAKDNSLQFGVCLI